MRLTSLLYASLSFAALPLFAEEEETAQKTIELFPITSANWQRGEWDGNKVPPALHGWRLCLAENRLLGYELFAEKDGRRVFLQSSKTGFRMQAVQGGYWLLDGDSFFVVRAYADGRKPRVVWCGDHDGDWNLVSVTPQGDGLEFVLEEHPEEGSEVDSLEKLSVCISPDAPAEVDVEHTHSMELPGMGIGHLPASRISPDGKWVSVAYGSSCRACAVDVEQKQVSMVLNAHVDVIYGGYICYDVVGEAWGTDCCPAPPFLDIGDTYDWRFAWSVVWSGDPHNRDDYGDKGYYRIWGEFTLPDGDAPGEIALTRVGGPESEVFRFPFRDSGLVRKCWDFLDWDDDRPGSRKFGFGIDKFSLCGDKLFYCGKQSLITIGSQGVEGEEILLGDEALTTARDRFGEGNEPPIYHVSFTNGGALVAWFVASPESGGIIGRWHVRFYAQDGSIRRESVYDVPELSGELNDGDFLTPQVVGDCIAIVTNAGGKGVHYRILSPVDEQDDIFLRSPKQLWLIKAGHWLLGITRGEKTTRRTRTSPPPASISSPWRFRIGNQSHPIHKPQTSGDTLY